MKALLRGRTTASRSFSNLGLIPQATPPQQTEEREKNMNSNQIRKALMEMGFQIISPESQTQLKLTHGHCQGILSVDPNPQALGIALNYLAQNQARTLEWARAVARKAMQEAQG